MNVNILLLVMMITGLFSCGQTSKAKPDAADIDAFTSTRQYTYVDSVGNRVVITNSLPKGTTYTAPDRNNYFRVIYWSRIINETESPFEMNIHFSEEQYEVPGLSGSHYKILVLPDTMTVDKENSYDYGITGLKNFLDNNIDRSSSISRIIKPKESTGFYFVLLSLITEIKSGATIRTGLRLKGQNLVYKISRYATKPGHPLLSEKEINCGSINLTNFVQQD